MAEENAAPAPAPAVAPEAAPDSGYNFTDGVNGVADEELKGWIQNKGFDSVGKMAQSYRGLEQMFGADKAGNTVIRPGENATDEDRSNFFNQLGRPEQSSGYSFPTPEGDSSSFTDWAKTTFHEIGISDDQASKLVEKWNAHQQGSLETTLETYNQNIKLEETALKKEWGGAFDNNMIAAKRAAAEFGLESETIDNMEKAMGFGNLMRFMNNVGEKLGDDNFELPSKRSDGFTPITPGQALAEISSIKTNAESRKKYLAGDQVIINRMHFLHEAAYGKQSQG